MNRLFHGTRRLDRVLATDLLLASESDDGQWAVCFSRCPRTAASFARGPQGGLLVFDRTRLRARVRLQGHHMANCGYNIRGEGQSEFEERALRDVDRIHSALLWWYDAASIPPSWAQAPFYNTNGGCGDWAEDSPWHDPSFALAA